MSGFQRYFWSSMKPRSWPSRSQSPARSATQPSKPPSACLRRSSAFFCAARAFRRACGSLVALIPASLVPGAGPFQALAQVRELQIGAQGRALPCHRPGRGANRAHATAARHEEVAGVARAGGPETGPDAAGAAAQPARLRAWMDVERLVPDARACHQAGPRLPSHHRDDPLMGPVLAAHAVVPGSRAPLRLPGALEQAGSAVVQARPSEAPALEGAAGVTAAWARDPRSPLPHLQVGLRAAGHVVHDLLARLEA